MGQVLGMGGEELRARLGNPSSERTVGGDTWLVYSIPAGRLRIRLFAARSEDVAVASSWTFEPSRPADSFDALLDMLNLSRVGPIDAPAASRGRLLRAELGGERVSASVTATVLDDRVASVTAFDEAPDWTPKR